MIIFPESHSLQRMISQPSSACVFLKSPATFLLTEAVKYSWNPWCAAGAEVGMHFLCGGVDLAKWRMLGKFTYEERWLTYEKVGFYLVT